jgi:hypothetical protein
VLLLPWTLKPRKSCSNSRSFLDEYIFIANTINSPPGAPAGANAGVQYTCNTSRGAVLLAHGPVTSAWLEGVGAMKTWVNENIDTLVKKGDWASIGRRGLWVITRTHYAHECAKTVFRSKDNTASFHAGASVPDVAKAKASAAWWNADHTSSGWIVHGVSSNSFRD